MKILAWLWTAFATFAAFGAFSDRLVSPALIFLMSALIAAPVPLLAQLRERFGLTGNLRRWAIAISGISAMVTLALSLPDAPELRAEREKAKQVRILEDAAASKRAKEAKVAEDKRLADEKALANAKAAEERKSGFHCLSSWDGSHRALINALKDSLRDPDSFQHVETRITPTDAKGNHMLLMKYRAKNGFGGMNVGQLAAIVKDADCSFEIVANNSN